MRTIKRAILALVLLGALGGVVLMSLFNEALKECNPSGGVTVAPASGANSAKQLDAEQQKNAAIVLGVAEQRNLSLRDSKITLWTAWQESKLYNDACCDLDSGGLFQQRPSQGWGSYDQVRDPVHATNKFIDRLLQVDNRARKSPLDIALEVQNPSRAAYLNEHNNFLSHEPLINAVLQSQEFEGSAEAAQAVYSDTSCGFMTIDPLEVVVQKAIGFVSDTFAWGSATDIFDFALFNQSIFESVGVKLPATSARQVEQYTKDDDLIEKSRLSRGDLLFFGEDATNITQTMFYLGNNQAITADSHGQPIYVTNVAWDTFVGGTRPIKDVDMSRFYGEWQMPLREGSRTSPFGMRVHPYTGEYKLHDGQDWGTNGASPPIYAAGSGVVESVGYQSGYGNTVIINHGTVNGKTIKTLYGHMSRFSGISEGQSVAAGTIIGYVGSTGYSTGKHLHFTVWENDRAVNPIAFLTSQGVKVL